MAKRKRDIQLKVLYTVTRNGSAYAGATEHDAAHPFVFENDLAYLLSNIRKIYRFSRMAAKVNDLIFFFQLWHKLCL